VLSDDGPIAAEKYYVYEYYNLELNKSVVIDGLYNIWICIKFHKKFKQETSHILFIDSCS
jgi:hypothetical protein